MATEVTNYQCPACTGPLHYSGTSGKLECEYCGSSYTVEEIEALYAQKNDSAEKAHEKATSQPKEETWSSGDGMQAYSCPSCGAELMCDNTTAATSCPYCGNPTVVPGKFSETRKPDYVIPFAVDKNAAIAALKQHYRKKPLLPKAFSKENHIQEIQGVYVPFWLFDGEGKVDAVYECTRSHSTIHGNTKITKTDHFMVRRNGTVSFSRIPVDGSSKMPDENMDSIEPFDYNGIKPFSMAYLPGYLADRYDVDAKEASKRADVRCKESCESSMRDTVIGYHTVVKVKADVDTDYRDVKYALFPVWMLHTKWHNKDYLFSMNGQTGKLTGNLPTSMGRFWGIFAAICVPLSALALLIMGL